MDQNHNEYESIYDQVIGDIEWFNLQSTICQKPENKASIKDSSSQNHQWQIYENDDFNLKDSESQEIPTNCQLQQKLRKSTSPQNLSIIQTIKDSKTKFITKKSIDPSKQKMKPLSKQKMISKKTKSIKPNKSRFNNMGGFLIGTFSQILNIRDKYRFIDGVYQIFIHSKWIPIGQINSLNPYTLEKEINQLKHKLAMLPRKQGAKKHLFEILNDENSQTIQIKMSKNLLRRQIIYSLNQRSWLLYHVSSRDFKPQNDDDFGTKKKQRHEAYLSYLLAIQFFLRNRNKLPKRISF